MIRSLLRGVGPDGRVHAAVILTIGATLAGSGLLCAIASAHLLRPLPYADDTRLVTLMEREDQSQAEPGPVSGGTAEDWRLRAKSVEQLGTYSSSQAFLAQGSQVVPVQVAYVSERFFDTLRVAPRLGVPFDATCETARQVLLSEGLWRSRFGARADVLDSLVQISGRAYQVVGVLPASVNLPAGADAWQCEQLSRPMAERERTDRYRQVVARLRSDVALGDAERELRQISKILALEHPLSNAGWTAVVRPLRTTLLADAYEPLLVLAALSPVVFVMGLINLTALVAAIAEGRRARWNLQAALGARREQVLAPELRSLALIWAAGVCVGILLLQMVLRVLEPLWFTLLPFGDTVQIDMPTTWFLCAGAATLLCAITMICARGVLHAWSHPEATVAGEGVRQHAGLGHMRHALMSAQLSVASFLLFVAVWLLLNYASLARADLGFVGSRLLTIEVATRGPLGTARPWALLSDYGAQIVSRFAADGRVASAAIGGVPLLGGDGIEVSVASAVGDAPEQRAVSVSVSEHFFSTVGATLIEGRPFESTDSLQAVQLERGVNPDETGVAIVTHSGARRLWPDGPAVGRRVRLQPDYVGTREIVGVVAVMGGRLAAEHAIRVYVPFSEAPRQAFDLSVRLHADAHLSEREVRDVVASVHPELVVRRIQTADSVVSQAKRQPLALTTGVLVLALLAMWLTIGGVYTLSRFVVRKEAASLAIRIALGASPLRLVRTTLARQARSLMAGTGGGLGLAWFWVHTFQPTTPWLSQPPLGLFLPVAVVLALASAGAGALPSWRMGHAIVNRLLAR